MSNPVIEHLKSLPPRRPWNSELLPYEQEIRDLRKSRKTYREIAAILEDRHGSKVKFSHATIWHFIRVRSKRTPYALPEPPTQQGGGVGGPVPVLAAPVLQPPFPAVVPRQPTPAVHPQVPPPAAPKSTIPPSTKHYDRTGKPVPGPPDPNRFRSINL